MHTEIDADQGARPVRRRSWLMRHRSARRWLMVVAHFATNLLSTAAALVTGALAAMAMAAVLTGLVMLIAVSTLDAPAVSPDSAMIATVLVFCAVLGMAVAIVRQGRRMAAEQDQRLESTGSVGAAGSSENRVAAIDLVAQALMIHQLSDGRVTVLMEDQSMGQQARVLGRTTVMGRVDPLGVREIFENDQLLIRAAGCEAMSQHQRHLWERGWGGEDGLKWFTMRWVQIHEMVRTHLLARAQLGLDTDRSADAAISRSRSQAASMLGRVPEAAFDQLVDQLLRERVIDEIDIADALQHHGASIAELEPWARRSSAELVTAA